MKGEKATGVGHPFEVFGENLQAELHYVRWGTGEREVRCESATVGPPAILQIGGGRRRLTIFSAVKGPYSGQKRRFVGLQQARIKDPLDGHSNLFGANLDELNEGAGLDVEEVLLESGGVAFGTRGEILNEDGRTRNQFCVVFEGENMFVPIVAYVVTRILPLMEGVMA